MKTQIKEHIIVSSLKNDVCSNSLLRSMIIWKWMPGFLYHIIRMGEESKTAERQRESVCEIQCVTESEG